MSNKVFIACSLDGYIADKDEGLDWLNTVPNPEQLDMGYNQLMGSIDALVMGRRSFETVCAFDCDWPYTKPVFVLSNSLAAVPETYAGKAEVVSGDLHALVSRLHANGFRHLYIDGGRCIQHFLQANLIDELIITRMPVLLGGGTPLFRELPSVQHLEHLKTEVFLGQVVQSHYRIKPQTSLSS